MIRQMLRIAAFTNMCTYAYIILVLLSLISLQVNAQDRVSSITNNSNTARSDRRSPAPVVVAITFQHLDVRTSLTSASALTPSTDTILHFTCFATTSSPNHNPNPNHQDYAQECCREFRIAANGICEMMDMAPSSFPSSTRLLSRPLNDDDDDDDGGALLQCPDIGAPVPLLTNDDVIGNMIGDGDGGGGGEDDVSSSVIRPVVHPIPIPIFYMAIPLALSLPLPDDATAALPLMQYNNYNSDGRWSQHRAYSPLQIEIEGMNSELPKDDHDDVSIRTEAGAETETPHEPFVPFFTAKLKSTISNEGGMHRAYQHVISISARTSIAKDDADANAVNSSISSSSIAGQVYLVLPQSEGIFLDMDDPFQNGDIQHACRLRVLRNNQIQERERGYPMKASCNVQMVTAPHAVIDIEQPAFVSPQHVVALRIEFQVENYDDDDEGGMIMKMQDQIDLALELEVVTNLHFRYPMIISAAGHLTGFVEVHVPTPFLHGARFESRTNIPGQTKVANAHVLDRCMGNTSGAGCTCSGSAWENVMIEVPAGVDEHHDLVMITTVVISLIGAWRMLHDMSKVSLWK